MEIDLSTLSNNQKKFYVELLAQSNLEFKKDNQHFVAQFKVNTANLPNNVPPNLLQEKDHNCNEKSRITRRGGAGVRKDSKKGQSSQPQQLSKPMNKKNLSKVVKLGELTKLETLHPTVEVYIYPKRMTAWHIQEVIESIYQKFWNEHKKRSSKLKQVCFLEWNYKLIGQLKEKMKIEQNLVNLVDSINHYSHKMIAVKIFEGFLSEKWSIDALFYFLVMRGLLEQVTGDRILDKISTSTTHQPFQSILGFKLRTPPQDKPISQQQVLNFINILKTQGLFYTKSKQKSYDTLFDQLTKKMYYNDATKKNYINFYELLEFLISQYCQIEVSSCDLSLSKTQFGAGYGDESISELITGEVSQDNGKKIDGKEICVDENMTFSVGLEPQDQYFYEEHEQQQEARDLAKQFETLVIDRANEMYSKMSSSTMSEQTLEGLMACVHSITKLDKSNWISFRGGISDAELLSLQKMQASYRQNNGSTVLITKLCKQLMLMPVVRELIVKDIRL